MENARTGARRSGRFLLCQSTWERFGNVRTKRTYEQNGQSQRNRPKLPASQFTNPNSDANIDVPRNRMSRYCWIPRLLPACWHALLERIERPRLPYVYAQDVPVSQKRPRAGCPIRCNSAIVLWGKV